MLTDKVLTEAILMMTISNCTFFCIYITPTPTLHFLSEQTCDSQVFLIAQVCFIRLVA